MVSCISVNRRGGGGLIKLTSSIKAEPSNNTGGVREMTKDEKIRVLVKGLANIASNLGHGSFRPSREDDGARPLRIEASETLHKAGYEYYECCGRDNVDGWFTKQELNALPER